MLKKIRDKRIETFKKSFPDYKISEKGNYWVKVGLAHSIEDKKPDLENYPKKGETEATALIEFPF